jgi:protein tyrosine phosphatase (PTP) superfamily phosphohydrolase (DUF442 family)
MEIEASYNFRRIDDRLTTSGIVRQEALKSLASQGYEVVVNLLPDSSEYAVRNEREIVESQQIDYIHIPVDFRQPTRRGFSEFCETLEKVAGRKVHVHCAANYRVSAFYSLYEVSCGRWSSEQAMEFMRGIWEPADHPGWAEFVASVIETAQEALAADAHKASRG